VRVERKWKGGREEGEEKEDDGPQTEILNTPLRSPVPSRPFDLQPAEPPSTVQMEVVAPELDMGHFFVTQPDLTQDFPEPTRLDPVGIGQ